MTPFKTVAAAALVLVLALPATLALAGEIVIDPQQTPGTPTGAPLQTNSDRARAYSGTGPGGGPNVIVVAPDAAAVPAIPQQTNEEAIGLGRARAKVYSNPSQAGEGPTVIITPGGTSGDTAQTNHEAVLKNSAKAGAYVHPDQNGGQGTSVIILAPDAGAGNNTATNNADALARSRARAKSLSQGRHSTANGAAQTLVIVPGTPSPDGLTNSQRLDSSLDKARAWSDGDGARRNCTTSSVSVGTIGNTVIVDRAGNATSASAGVTTTAIGGCQ